METYTNSRWRESGGGRLPTGFSSYSNHHHSLPDHNFISERRSNSHERQRVPLLTNPPTGPYHPPMLENGYNSWAGGGVRNKERLLEEDYGYHPSPPYQLDSVPVHGRGGGGGRRGTFDARRHHHVSNNNSPSNSTPPHYPPGPRSNPHSWDLNGPRGSHGSNNHSGGPPMFNEGNSPLSYSPAYSDTTASSPDTRWDSPCTSSPRREIRGRGGGEPARDPRRRSHHILPQTPPPPPLPSQLPPPPQVKKEAYHFGSVDRGMTMDYSNSAARVREYDPNMRPRGYHNPSLRVNTRPGDNNYGCSRTRIYLPPMKRPRMQSKSYHIRKENGNGAFDDESQRVSKNVSIQRILFEHSYSRALPLLLQGKARVPDRKYHHRLSPYPEAALKRTMLTRTSKKVAVPPLEVKERATIPESELKGNVSETESTSSDSVMSLVDSELLDLDTDSEGGDSSRDSTDLSPLMLSIPRTLNSDLPYINRTSTNHNQPGMMNGPERKPVSPQQVSDVPDETENEAASLNNSLASSDGESFHLFMESEEEDKSGKEHKESIDIRGSHLGSLNHSQDDTLSVASSESGKSPRKIKSSFRDFIPQILETRSRAETATMRRRLAMEKKMKLHQRSISVESELHQLSPKSNSIISQDDTSSIISGGSSYQAFDYNREFSPEFVKRMKRTYATRPIGSGDSNLHKVCRSGRLRAVRYFILVEQLNVNTQDNAGWTPLHEACNNGYSDVVKALLEYGADPNLTSYDGSRPIHDAIEAGNITIVRLLVEHGANLMAEQGGKTPVDLARSLGHSDIASYLDDVLLGDQNKRQKKNVTITEVVRPSSLKKNGAVQSFADSTCHPPITLPFDGYDTGLSFGLELDSPVVFLSAVVEQSSLPFLPLYNITVSSGTNPRKHNFHILTDLLTHLSFTRETLLSKLTGIKILTLSIEEFLTQIRANPLTKHSPIVEKLQSCPQDEVIELIPLCNALRNLLKIEVSNIDD